MPSLPPEVVSALEAIGNNTKNSLEVIDRIQRLPRGDLEQFVADLYFFCDGLQAPNGEPSNAAGSESDPFGAMGASVSSGGAMAESSRARSPLPQGGSLSVRSAGDQFYGSMSVANRAPVREYSRLQKVRDEDGNKIINGYTLVAELGRGAQGKVKLAYSTDDPSELVAIKIVNRSLLSKNPRALALLKKEIAIMKKLRHRNIVSLHAVVDDPESNKLYLVMDYIPGGTLLSQGEGSSWKVETEENAKRYMRQMIDGLRYLHRHGISHRDVKPANLLKGEHGRVYLADFGVSSMLEDDDGSSQGTPAFWPPELFEESSKVPGEVQDMWALGVTLFVMLHGKLPFEGENFRKLADSVKSGSPSFSDSVSKPARDLLEKMLNKNADERLTLANIREHDFFGNEASSTKGEVIVVTTPDEEEGAITRGSGIQLTIRFMLLRARPQLKAFIKRIRERVREREAKKKEEEAEEKAQEKAPTPDEDLDSTQPPEAYKGNITPVTSNRDTPPTGGSDQPTQIAFKSPKSPGSGSFRNQFWRLSKRGSENENRMK